MTTSDIALLGSDVLIYAYQSLSALHEQAKALRDRGMDGGIQLCVCPQVLMEFYAFVTDPKHVTCPAEPREAMSEVEKYLEADEIIKIYPKDDLLIRMMTLFRKYQVKRHEIFDIQLVATMLSNGVNKLHTYDKEHFSRFTELEILSP